MSIRPLPQDSLVSCHPAVKASLTFVAIAVVFAGVLISQTLNAPHTGNDIALWVVVAPTLNPPYVEC